MFSKNNTYLFPEVSSSSLDHHHHHSTRDTNGVEIFLHHHPEYFSGHYYSLGANNVPVAAADHHQGATNLLTQNDAVLSGEYPSAMANAFQLKKQTPKKDRHSKIFTSQGPRDRRVRLSIGIARKFFDLQEMLGFDKPSKTLDWLLTKSKAAIKELVQTKEKAGADKKSSSSVPSDSELRNGEGDYECGADSKGKYGNKNNNNKGLAISSSSNLAKESRAKARARARERTREKMSIKQLKINGGSESNHPFDNPTQYSKNSQLGVFELPAGSSTRDREGMMFHCPMTNEGGTHHHHQDLIRESVVIKRKTKNPNSFFGLQQNAIVSRDSSSNYGVPFANAAGADQNWDICSFTSNMSAVLDHHKFMNSSSNM